MRNKFLLFREDSPAGGYCAGLIEDDRINAMSCFKNGAALDEQSIGRTNSSSNHHSRGRSKTQSTWAGHNHNTNCAHQGNEKSLLSTNTSIECRPSSKGDYSKGEDGRGKYRCDIICHGLDWGLVSLGILNKADDSRQNSLCSSRCDPNKQDRQLIDR